MLTQCRAVEPWLRLSVSVACGGEIWGSSGFLFVHLPLQARRDVSFPLSLHCVLWWGLMIRHGKAGLCPCTAGALTSYLPPPSLPSGRVVGVIWKNLLSSGGGNLEIRWAAGRLLGLLQGTQSSSTPVILGRWRLDSVYSHMRCLCFSQLTPLNACDASLVQHCHSLSEKDTFAQVPIKRMWNNETRHPICLALWRHWRSHGGRTTTDPVQVVWNTGRVDPSSFN